MLIDFRKLSFVFSMADLISGDKINEIMDAFNSMADSKGVVQTKRLGDVLKALGENPTKEEVQDMINEVDKEGLGVVKFPTFLAMMASKLDNLVAEDEIREAFCVFDIVRWPSVESLTNVYVRMAMATFQGPSSSPS